MEMKVQDLGLSKEESSKHERSSSLPLNIEQDWYTECGCKESKNRARSDSRVTNTINVDDEGQLLGTNRSKVSGTLQENVEALKQKVESTKISEKKSRLLAVLAVGEQLCADFPIISTQEAGKIYHNTLAECTTQANRINNLFSHK